MWNNAGGVLRPLGERCSDVEDPASQLWLRASAADPWVVDVPLTSDVDDRWTHEFLLGEEAEVVFSYKARLRRPKDAHDLEACLPVLSAAQRDWLHTAVARTAPGHPWLGRL